MSENLNATLKKVLVVFLIITLTYANFLLIGSKMVKGSISYALEEQEKKTTVVAEQNLILNKICEIKGEEKRVIQIMLQTGIENTKSPIKQTTITLNKDIIPATVEDVKVSETSKMSYTSGNWEISEDGEIIISLINESGNVDINSEGEDKESTLDAKDVLIVTYVFPKTEIETIKTPLQKVEVTTYSGETLTNECEESSFENTEIESEPKLINIESKDIHKTTIAEGKAEYNEVLTLDLSYRNEAEKIVIEDETNKFYKKNGTIDSETTLKYKTTKIYKEDLLNLIGENGKVTITDQTTGKTIAELTSEYILNNSTGTKVEQKFTDEEKNEEETRSFITIDDQNIIIEYALDIANLKMEIANITAQSNSKIEKSEFMIENTKTVSTINLDNLDCLKENIKYTIGETEKTVTNTIKFKDTTTRANLAVDNTEWVVGQANTVKYTITLDTTSEKSELYNNPMFLIELPSNVESVNAQNSKFEVNNDNGAFDGKRVFVTTVLGRKFVVITLEGMQTEETIKNGDTTIDLTLELNVIETEEENQTTKLYYQNSTITAYESGKDFDTAEVTVEMIMESEPKYEIEEYNDISLLLQCFKGEILSTNEEFEYYVDVCNYSSEERQNLQLTSILPEGISIVSIVEVEKETESEVEYTFDESSRKLTIDIEKIDKTIFETIEEGINIPVSMGSKEFKITVKTENLPEGTYSREIKTSMTLSEGEEILAKSKEIIRTISNSYIDIEVGELPESINELETISLGLKIVNKGLIYVEDINVNINIPKEIDFTEFSTKVISSEGTEQTESSGTVEDDFKLKNICLEAGEIYYLQLTGKVNYIKTDTTVTVTGKVNEKEITWNTKLINVTNDDPEESENPTNPSNPEDPTNPSNPENPTNPSNPEDPTSPSNPEDQNKGEEKTEGFDLSLKQYINKITVTNSKGTTTYEYKDTDFAKVEIHSKQMNGSKITLEYSILVKNEGTIPGYARKIVDYIPKDLIFNSEQNSDWYLGDDGNLYSTKFINKLLQPGETAEVKIILEKEMTNENTGTITNLVEIYEASNNADVEDVNSIPGDRLEGQNDMSKVEVLIVTSTGTIILYTTLAIVVIAIIGVGLYKIKRSTLSKKGGC